MKIREKVLWAGCGLALVGLVAVGLDIAGRMRERPSDSTNDIVPTKPKAESVQRGHDEVPISGKVAKREAAGIEPNPSELCGLLREALVSKNAAKIAEYRQQILALGDECIPKLQSLVNCGEAKVELEALRLLTQIGGNEGLVIALGRVLTVQGNNQHLPEYLAVFGACKDAGISEWLVDFLGKTERDDVRQRVLAILRAVKGGDVVASLALQRGEASDDLHAEDCAATLAQCNDPSHVGMLEDIFLNAHEHDIRQIAAIGLAHVGNREACEFLISGASGDGKNAEYCLESIPLIRSSYGQETLLNAACDRSLPDDVRGVVVAALSNHRSSRVRTVLQNLANDETSIEIQSDIDESLQVLAAHSSGNSGTATGPGEKKDETWF